MPRQERRQRRVDLGQAPLLPRQLAEGVAAQHPDGGIVEPRVRVVVVDPGRDGVR